MRASMLTRRHPFRTGIGTALWMRAARIFSLRSSRSREAFAANAMVDYHLASFGKWHLIAGPGTPQPLFLREKKICLKLDICLII